jgi:protein-L-isoaspartate(D-aspartate) O-methyltransferase
MVAEIDALFAETRYDTGLAAMSPAVRAAMLKVERHRLIAPGDAASAYRNHPLPIGHGQTISQPYVVALSTELIAPRPDHAVLDIGTGSGYQAAVLAELVARVYSVEIVEPLAVTAKNKLQDLKYRNIEIKVGDGYRGWPEKGPFDGIIVTAAAPQIPQALVDQLKPGGRMVIPVGAAGGAQDLVLVTKGADGSVQRKNVLAVRFVPLVPGK